MPQSLKFSSKTIAFDNKDRIQFNSSGIKLIGNVDLTNADITLTYEGYEITYGTSSTSPSEFPQEPNKGDFFFITSSGDNTTDIIEQWVYDGESWKDIALGSGSNEFTGNQVIDGNVFADNYKGYNSLVGTASSDVIIFNVTSVTKTSNHRYFGTGSAIGYHIDGVEAPFLTLLPGKTYWFDQSDSSNNTHQLRFYYQADKTTEFTDVTYNGIAGSSGAYTQIVVTDTTPTVLHYQCVNHGYMGNSAGFNSNVIDTPYLINAQSGVATTSLTVNGPISQTGLSNFSTIIGSGAGTPTGTVNTLIGFQAGRDLGIGFRNTYVGTGAGAATTEGASNTFIGQSAGSNNVSGSSNIIIGRSAGNTLADGTTPVTTLGQSIFIGNFTKSGNDNIFNQIVIGTNAVGEGENTVTIGNSNIVSTHLKGTVFGSTFTGSFVGDGSGLTGIAGGGSIDTSSFATTGSNTFTGDQTISGSVIISGSISQVGIGNYNTAIGTETFLSNNTSGEGNTAVGAFNLQNNTTGFGNTAIGFVNLTNNLTGNSNVAIGVTVLENNTSGNNNVAIGGSPLSSNTSGNSNIAIGLSALGSNTTGLENIAVGDNALTSVFGAQRNIAIGKSALSFLEQNQASDNTAIGFEAGRLQANGQSLIIAASSIFIGTGTRAEGLAQSNQIVIGNTAIGNGSNTVTIGNSNIVSTHLKGTVFAPTFTGSFVGSSIAATSLTVNGSISQVGIGEANTIIGDRAGLLNNPSAGDYNTFIGVDAAAANVFGRGNTAIGSNALYNNSNGDSNIAIGSGAGSETEGLGENLISNESIYIGNGSQAKSNNQYNQIVIGNFVTGNGSNTVTIGDSNITDTYLRGTVTATSFVGDGSNLTNIPVGPQGPIGPQGPSGDGSGDVNSTGTEFTDNAIVRYDGTTGDIIHNSLVTISDNGAITAPNNTGSMIPFYYETFASFPAATSSHGAVAHAHDTGKLYYAHGTWIELANLSDVTEGPIGLTGETGPQGIQGETGLTGADGAQGPAGPIGLTGETGPQGIQGETGLTGADGAQGPAGPAGSDGQDGLPGPAGPVGPAGPAGSDGQDGLVGPVGPDGLVGPVGPQGIQGEPGSSAITWQISASGSSDYVFSGPGIVTGNTNGPTLYLYRGFTYVFVNNTGTSHPFAIQNSNGSFYAGGGLTGSTTGTQTFIVPMNAPTQLRYICTIHSSMQGIINIV